MHHTLAFYARNRERFLWWYIFFAKWTKVPVIGWFVRWVANKYGERQHGAYLLTPDEAVRLVDLSPDLALGPCSCREVFHNCDHDRYAEIMLVKGHNPFLEGRPDRYRSISRKEAKEVLKSCHGKGLIATVIKCREDYYAICNCCTCCCVPLRLKSKYGIGKAAVRAPDIVGEFQEWLGAPPHLSPTQVPSTKFQEPNKCQLPSTNDQNGYEIPS